MSNALPPEQVLSQIEDQKGNALSLRLATLGSRRDALTQQLEEADLRLTEARQQREQLSRDTMTALHFSMLEAERHEEQGRKNSLIRELETISAEGKELKAKMLVSMSKSKSYLKLLEHEKKLQQKHAARVEQRMIDDLMAHRRMRGAQ